MPFEMLVTNADTGMVDTTEGADKNKVMYDSLQALAT